ncbi:amino acid adenylation domain-containing protein [Streptacidiphilus sp. PB12-B1b]|uniref:non-ribosomal peptide synthetase n=1 Tax=Streptacidiphilus sp. PB12-B1b TaxID=2705012 RepID=UPI0015F92B7F|nr:non-ribosomal peptide synthetase [Streptacidiphilus sp. PB12-B1b]QMU77306.1 amino acid adenylation domain-containing protein [Streptacidiphilus sp. PB12-B1b]
MDSATEEYEFPVSDAQGRLLVLDQLNPGTAQYTVPAAFAVHGPFDPQAFTRALDALVQRHEALRTTFRTTAPGGAPAQIVAAHGSCAVHAEHGVPADRAPDHLRAHAARPFDPATGPLLRCTLLHLDDGSHRVLLTAHHLVCDGWSLAVLLRELSDAYRHHLHSRPWNPPEPALQYPDWAAWQRERRDSGHYADAVAHWAAALRGAPHVLPLPLDRPRPALRTAAGGTVRLELPPALRERLAQAAARCSGTAFMVLLAAWAAFLGRLSGTGEVVLGYPVSGRDRAETQEMVGMLTNTVALRVDLSGDPSLDRLTERVRAAQLAAAPYQDAPFEAVVDAVAPTRETSHDPLVQAVLGYDDDTEPVLELEGARTRRLDLDLDVAKFDLHLQVARRGPELDAQLIYRSDLFDDATAAAWARAFSTWLDRALHHPGLPLSRIDAVPDDQRAATLARTDRTAQAAPPGPLVPELIARTAAARPGATALVCGDLRLTYRQLMQRADALAARLRARRVTSGVRVGLLLPRGADMAVAALAVLRAGGAYVPMDPAHPHDRLARMTASSGAALLLTTAPTAAAGAALPAPALRLDLPDAPGDPAPDTAPHAGPHPRDLAYVLFTSGSTGTPKGVAVEHRALANLTCAVRHAFPVTERDRVLQFVSFGFDVAVSDLFFPWTAGAELHIAQEHERLGQALLDRLRDSRITYAFLPPSAAMLLPAAHGQLPHLRTLAVGGEACPPELVQRLWEPGRRIVNAYGPSEATVYSTTADLHPDRPVVIGDPVPGARLYVLDQSLRTVPPGVTGEIYIAGAPLARGYIAQPALTAERFTADPYGQPGSRMYRTGDLGRIDAHGRLHYLGRSDTQVKLRGLRVELGEVETVLAAVPGVAHTAAAVKGTGNDARLIAYLVPRPGHHPTDADLRTRLADHLPGYMVPDAFVRLDELPLGASGKLDRTRLPDPATARSDLDRPYTAPADAAQQQVAAAWARALTLDRVGVHDNFFDLGGNSVRLMGVLADLREQYPHADLTLIDLFRRPTVATLAAHLTADDADNAAAGTDAADAHATVDEPGTAAALVTADEAGAAAHLTADEAGAADAHAASVAASTCTTATLEPATAAPAAPAPGAPAPGAPAPATAAPAAPALGAPEPAPAPAAPTPATAAPAAPVPTAPAEPAPAAPAPVAPASATSAPTPTAPAPPAASAAGGSRHERQAAAARLRNLRKGSPR